MIVNAVHNFSCVIHSGGLVMSGQHQGQAAQTVRQLMALTVASCERNGNESARSGSVISL